MNPSDMTVEELNALIQQKSNAIDSAKDDLRAVCRVRDSKAKWAAARAALDKMSPTDRAQFLSDVGGIPSGESVGTPGRS